MTATIQAFRNAFHAAALSVNMRVRRTNVAAPTVNWENVQAPPGKYLLAVMLEWSVALTATAATAVNAGTDILDEFIQGVEISPVAGGGAARIQTKSRKATEELERLVLDTSLSYTNAGWNAADAHIGSYPRIAAAAFAGAGARTDTAEVWLPVGGLAASIRITMPTLGTVFTTPANVTGVYTLGYFEVYSLYNGVVAAFENVTGTLAASSYIDLVGQNVVPTGLAVDIVTFIGETTANLTQIQVNDQHSLPVVSIDTTQTMNATQFIYPMFAQTTPSYGGLTYFLNKSVVTTFKVSLAAAGVLDILFIQVQGPSSVPENPAQTTPTTPAVTQVGSPAPGTGPTPSPPTGQTGSAQSGGSGGISSYTGPRKFAGFVKKN